MILSEQQSLEILSTHVWPLRPRAGTRLWQATQAAMLTVALSLPQGLLALPIAVAQKGVTAHDALASRRPRRRIEAR